MTTSFVQSFLRILLLVLVGVFVLGQFGRIELGMGRAIYFQDVILALIVVATLLTRGKTLLHSLVQQKTFQLWILFVIWIVFTSAINFHSDISQQITVLFYLLRLNCIVAFAIVLADFVKQKIVSAEEIGRGILFVGGSLAMLGFFQYAIFPDTRGLQLLGWDDHYYRLISTLFDPGFTGIILCGISLFAIWQILQSTSHQVIAKIIASVTAVAVLLTYSRASYLAFFAGVVTLAWVLKRFRLLLLIPLFVLCILLLPRPGGEGVKLERTASVLSRIDSVEEATRGVSGIEFLIGKGWYAKKQVSVFSKLGEFTVPNHSSAAENSYIFIFTSLGIIGTGILGLFVVSLWRTVLSDPLILTSTIAISVHALFSNTWFHPFVLLLFVASVVYGKMRTQSLR